ncbi:VOC family protein [Geodermatophilus sp. SYSU D00815]
MTGVAGRPVLGGVEETVLGAADLFAAAAFLSVLGMQVGAAPTLDEHAARELYGLHGPARQLRLTTPGTAGSVRLVETPHAAKPFQPLMAGPYGLDVYTTDVELSTGLARATGAYATDLVRYDVRGDVLQSREPQFETRYVGPDALSVYVSDLAACGHRFPTVLDREPDRLHSQVNMLVWVVEDLDAARRFWTEEAGLEVVVDRFEGEEGMVDLMAHPYETPLRVVNVADGARTRRIEFMQYPEARVGRRPNWPLHGGLHAAGFRVDDLDRAVAALPSADFRSPVVVDGRRAVAAEAPGGARFELWERTAG